MGVTYDERIEKVVKSARNNVALETRVHHHHICVETACSLG